MPVTSNKPSPYAPPSAILDIIDRYRNRGLPAPLSGEVLSRAGVSGSLVPRTLQALQVLDLINEDGAPTETLEGLRLAPEGEVKQLLADWVRAAYEDIFLYIDPSKDDETAIRDAFRGYQPIGQQSRMVTLFLGLCGAAGLAPEKPTQPRRRTRMITPAPPKRAASKKPSQSASADIPPALAGLLASLPPDGQGWSKNQREKFMDTFGAVLDFCIPIDGNGTQDEDTDNEEDRQP